MATGGGKPGFTARVKVMAVGNESVLFELKEVEYFTLGDEYVAFFQPAPPEHSSGGGGEQGNG